MEILRKGTDEDLDYILSEMKLRLPFTMKDVNYLTSMRRFQSVKNNFEDLSDKVLANFYIPNDNKKENCTIFAITGDRDHTVWFFTLENDLNELKNCLFNTKLIQWDQVVLFVTIHREHTGPIFEFSQLRNFQLRSNEEAAFYSLSKDKVMKFKIAIPDNTFVRELTKSDAKICNENWKYASTKSESFLASLIQLNGGYGLFCEESKEILSFGIFNEQLALGMITTVDKARRKGYGEFIAKFLSVKFVEKFDISPMVFIDMTNSVSINLFVHKLGYEKIAESNWIVVGNSKY